MNYAVEPSEAVGMSARRLERIRPAMQAYVDSGGHLKMIMATFRDIKRLQWTTNPFKIIQNAGRDIS